MRLSVPVLAAGFCLLSTMAQAQAPQRGYPGNGTDALLNEAANEFLQQYATASSELKGMFYRHVIDVEDGLSWANVSLKEDRKEQPLYCVPTGLSLTGGQLMNILQKDVEETPSHGKVPVGLVLLVALKKVFPCQPASR